MDNKESRRWVALLVMLVVAFLGWKTYVQHDVQGGIDIRLPDWLRTGTAGNGGESERRLQSTVEALQTQLAQGSQSSNPTQPSPPPQGGTVECIDQLNVPGSSSHGVQYSVPQTGVYSFQYGGGAYSTYPEASSPPGTPTWLTAIRVYRGDQPMWNGDRIDDSQAYMNLFDTSYHFSEQDAVSRARDIWPSETQLIAGDHLTFIAVDMQPAYSDNPKGVTIRICVRR